MAMTNGKTSMLLCWQSLYASPIDKASSSAEVQELPTVVVGRYYNVINAAGKE